MKNHGLLGLLLLITLIVLLYLIVQFMLGIIVGLVFVILCLVLALFIKYKHGVRLKRWSRNFYKFVSYPAETVNKSVKSKSKKAPKTKRK